MRHLADHEQLYWEVGFKIKRDKFSYPMLGYIHVCGGQVEYVATIQDILPFSPAHYEYKESGAQIKPLLWLQEWAENINNCRSRRWKNALVITRLEPFSYNTYTLHQYDGRPVTKAPQNYTRVRVSGHVHRIAAGPPRESASPSQPSGVRLNHVSPLAERNLEDFVIGQLEAIEPGLRLVSRQLSTPAGRLDILCQDNQGWYVVVELKRDQGSDRVVGQTLRYMGWAQEHYATENVRGIIVVGRKDLALTYAAKAVRNIQVKEFTLSIV